LWTTCLQHCHAQRSRRCHHVRTKSTCRCADGLHSRGLQRRSHSEDHLLPHWPHAASDARPHADALGGEYCPALVRLNPLASGHRCTV
jgi:hypothetical protein